MVANTAMDVPDKASKAACMILTSVAILTARASSSLRGVVHFWGFGWEGESSGVFHWQDVICFAHQKASGDRWLRLLTLSPASPFLPSLHQFCSDFLAEWVVFCQFSELKLAHQAVKQTTEQIQGRAQDRHFCGSWAFVSWFQLG